MDDCWSTKERDASGNLVADPQKWPRGIPAVVDEIHALGLKFGLYGCAGEMTCASYPGSWGHEVQDAELLASWGVDFWKHDNCFTPCPVEPPPQTCPDGSVDTKPWYGEMRDAFAGVADTKEIVFNLCNWGRNEVWTWGAEYGQSWRIETDNWGDWESVVRIGATASNLAEFSGPGGFNDLDMLVSKILTAVVTILVLNFSSLSATRCSRSPKSDCTSVYGPSRSRPWLSAPTLTVSRRARLIF